ncbi:hypothetical protein [Streptomyces sp. NPDC056323]|uniref:hypothetical protein n=1 Tax=unclassified Streptomyces TaxID=2593676 RepID=UPI0035DC3110
MRDPALPGLEAVHRLLNEPLGAPEHPYTRLLLGSVPRRGWDPAAATPLRRALG